DPVSVVVKNAAGWILLFARQYGESIAACQKVIEMDADYGEVYSQLRRAYEQKGMYAEALAADEKFRMFKTKAGRRSNQLSNPATISSAKSYWQKMLELARQDV